MNFKKVASEILNLIGGKDNVREVIHCQTRLRFTLKDMGKADEEKLKQLDGIITVIRSSGQFQVVIGPEVSKVYQELIHVIGHNDNMMENEVDMEGKGNLWNRFVKMISSVFVPIIGVMAGAGMLRGLLSLLTSLNVMNADGDTFQVINGIADTLFYFMPVLVGFSSAKYFKINQMVGAVIGAALIYPAFIQAAGDGSITSFMGIPMTLENYSSSVFPALAAVYLAALLEKPLKKIIPNAIQLFMIPALLSIITVPATLIVVGPVINTISGVLANIISASLNFSPILSGILLGGPWIAMVMLGLHWAFIPILINNLAMNGYDQMLGLLGANQMAMAGALIAVAIKTNDQKTKTLSWSTAIPCLFGVSEPGIYGVLLPRKKPFLMSIIGGSIGGAIAGAFGTVLYGVGVSGLFQITLAIGPDGFDTGFIGYIISIIVGFICGFGLTFISESKRESEDFRKVKTSKA